MPDRGLILKTSCLMLIAVVFAEVGSAQNTFKTVVQPLLREHCIRCHGAKQQKSDLRLDTLKPDFDAADQAAVWIEVMDNLNLGQMPPADQPRPDAAVHRKVVRWISAELKAARKRASGPSGQVVMRRLNRAEFSYTIRDLFSMRFLPDEDPAELLPPDATFDGFDKVGARLMLDPSLLAGYYDAARRIADKAIVNGPPKYPTRRTRFEWEDMAKPESGLSYVCGHGGMRCRENDVSMMAGAARAMRGLYYPGTSQMFPVTGVYTIRIRASADLAGRSDPLRLAVQRVDGRGVDLLTAAVIASPESPQVYSVTRPVVALPEAGGVYMRAGIANGDGTRVSYGLPRYWKHVAKVKEFSQAGNHAEALRLKARMKSEGWTGGNRPARVLLNSDASPNLILDWIEIEGPLYDAWPPRSHKTLFFKDDDTPKDVEYAHEMFAQFLPRAFRRPVDDTEVDRVVELVRKELEQGADFEDAIKVGLTYVLTSPAFLYIVEPTTDGGVDVGDPTQATRGRPGGSVPLELNEFALASRLSYFLWSSMPDQQLFKLASSGRLRDPNTLVREVDRMIDDPKSHALVEGFAAQWLRTSEFLDFTPDRKIYRDFDPALREHMVGETLAFFEEILRNDLSVLNFLDSEFVMVNEPLAEFYGLGMIQGPEFRRVTLPQASHRGGILGQAGVHIRGSDGRRTKPMNRAVYVREVLFNDPPDPPPPNAGEIEPNINGKQLTVRERLVQHRQIEACANCHRNLDVYGLALENFDATGAWRDRQNGEDFRGNNTPPIDCSGVLPNGTAFQDFEEFKTLLLKQDGRFRRALVEKLFVYALGREVEPADRDTIDSLAAQMVEHGDTLRAALKAVVSTQAFRSK